MAFKSQLEQERLAHRAELTRLKPDYLRDCLYRKLGVKPGKTDFVSTKAHPVIPFTLPARSDGSKRYLEDYDPFVPVVMQHAADGGAGPAQAAGGGGLAPADVGIEGGGAALNPHVGLARTKLFDVDGANAIRLLLSNDTLVLPLKLSQEELKAVAERTSIMVHGRAGTGKTQVLVSRGYAHQKAAEEMWGVKGAPSSTSSSGGGNAQGNMARREMNRGGLADADGGEADAVVVVHQRTERPFCEPLKPFVLFVTHSQTLALNVKKHYEGLLDDKVQINGRKKINPSWGLAQAVMVSSAAASAAASEEKGDHPDGVVPTTANDDEELLAAHKEASVGIGFAPLTPAERERELVGKNRNFRFTDVSDKQPYRITSYMDFLQVLDRSVGAVEDDDLLEHGEYFAENDLFFVQVVVSAEGAESAGATGNTNKALARDGGIAYDPHEEHQALDQSHRQEPDAEVNFRRFARNYWKELRGRDAEAGNAGLEAHIPKGHPLRDPMLFYKELSTIKNHCPFEEEDWEPAGQADPADEAGGDRYLGGRVRLTMNRTVPKTAVYNNSKGCYTKKKAKFGRKNQVAAAARLERQLAGVDFDDGGYVLNEDEDHENKPLTHFEKQCQHVGTPLSRESYVKHPPRTSLLHESRGGMETEREAVFWDGNGLAYPHRTGFRPVSDQCLLPHTQSMSQCLLPHAQSMSPCHVRCTVS